MELKEFIQNLRSQNIEISINNDKLKVSAPKGKSSPEILQKIKDNRDAILGYLREEKVINSGRISPESGCFFDDRLAGY